MTDSNAIPDNTYEGCYHSFPDGYGYCPHCRIEELESLAGTLELSEQELDVRLTEVEDERDELRARLEAAYWDGRADERKEAEAVMEAVRGLQRYHQIPWKGEGYLPQMYESPEGEFVRADELDKALKGGGDD